MHNDVAKIEVWEYTDAVTGDKIGISVSPWYSKLTINNREYYFRAEDGKFDGTSMPMKD